MYDIKSMVKYIYNNYKNDSKYSEMSESKMNFLARLTAYEYLRYKVPYKTKIMPFDVYSEYLALEMSILISDLNYKGHRNLKNGYDHLYNEMQPLFHSLDKDTKHDLSEACLEFASDICNSSKIKKYLENEAVKTYVRFVANRYRNVVYHYDLEKYIKECEAILNEVGYHKHDVRK